MSSVQENFDVGYDENRFQGQVRRDLICSICHDVLKDPRICQNKEHPFCLACILRHLQDSPTCPVCREHLTPETLKIPPRFLMNCLLELNINCDYNDRGCPDYVQLGNLQSHVDQCGFAPATCGNEGCGMEVNRRDKDNHEKNFCQYRIPKCHECRDIKASQDEMKVTQHEIKSNQSQMKVDLNDVKRQMNEVRRKQEEIDARMRQIDAGERKLQASVEEIKQTQEEMKNGMRQQSEMLKMIMRQTLPGRNVNKNITQAKDSAVPLQPTTDQVIIIGGWRGPEKDKILNTVEMFHVIDGKSVQLPAMNHARVAPASCLYKNDVMVTGGDEGRSGTDTIELLKMTQHPLRWVMFDAKLPVNLSSHDVIVYLDKLFVIGGLDWNVKQTSDAIYEVSLTPPYTGKLVIRMPQPRKNHRAELVNDQLFILGGITTNESKNATDSVVVYDFQKKQCKPCLPLPRPVYGMSAVTWGNAIILAGGSDENGNALNDVIMYDTEAGRSEKLPSMIYKRCGCSSVIINDVIVVAGGWNEEQRHLKSVECLTIGNDAWKKLPEMKEKRHWATAVVKLCN